MTSSAEEASGAEGTEPLSLSPQEMTGYYLDMWKQTVSVQQHFNDLELRIRTLALTALTFTLGAAGIAAKDGVRFEYGSANVSAGSAIAGAGLMLWFSFWFVDRIWYHRLLIGSVIHGAALEKELSKTLPHAGLTQAISDNSPSEFKLWWRPSRPVLFTLHSSGKLTLFYVIGAIPLLLLALLLFTPVPTVSTPTSPTPAPSASSSISR